jgi:protein-tyrosine phosphatase
VLFLCQGNIHRSAFAAQRTKNALHWQDKLQITSAGFVPENRRPTSQVSLRAAKTLNVDLSRHQSQTVTTAMLAQADLIFIMDQEQLLQVRNLDASLIKKVVLLGALDPLTPDWEIGDPDGKSQEVYQRTYAKISRCIEAWLQHRSEVASRKLQDTDYSSLPLFSTAK